MIRTLLIILSLPLLALINTQANAQTTVETAFVQSVRIIPTADGGHSIAGIYTVKVDPGQCEALVAEAEAAMHAEEDKAVLLYNRTSWTHKSFAGCLRVQMEVQVDPAVSTQTAVLCVREYGPGFDWFGACPE